MQARNGMADIVDRISHMLTEGGTDLYGGEAITQTQHALQCAALAEAAGASPALIAASLLHDIGHFLDPEFEEALAADRDLEHETVGEAFLEAAFGADVTRPVKMHVAAKRYLCVTKDGYHAGLSDASKHSLALQGGRRPTKWRPSRRIRITGTPFACASGTTAPRTRRPRPPMSRIS